ncbi:MAG: 50S ribosomal protein L31 [Patescibacteria group bacterium]|nr:50S ribosomal protein L31 [Patescibacteria group bacterium]
MKKDIHPEYGPCTIKCACGNVVKTRASVSTMDIEICSACHPFYTGKKKIVDATGRVDRFMKRLGKSKSIEKKVVTSAKKAKKKTKKKIIGKKKISDLKVGKKAKAKAKTKIKAN